MMDRCWQLVLRNSNFGLWTEDTDKNLGGISRECAAAASDPEVIHV